MRVVSNRRKIVVLVFSILTLGAILFVCALVHFFPRAVDGSTEVKTVLLIPMTGQDIKNPSMHNEASHVYDKYFKDSKEYKIGEFSKDKTFYLNKDNIGLYSLDVGKSNAVTSMAFLLDDPHFNFDNCNFILYGSCGSSKGLSVPGDVIIGSGIVDYELGFAFDSKDTNGEIIWYEDKGFRDFSHFNLNDNMIDNIYNETKDIKLETTKDMREYLSQSFNNESWAVRDPKVQLGTVISADSYWKGEHSHQRANYMTNYYKMKDPFLATSMEDSAIANLFSKMGILDRFLVVRYSVNMDVFLKGQNEKTLTGEDSDKYPKVYSDLFNVANENGIKVLDKIFLYLNGK